MSVKLFTDGTAAPNFCSKTDESFSETRAKCRPKDSTYDGDRQLPIEVYSYHHTLPTGHVITFDRGHGCDHADTLEHGGTLSTSDIDNFVPQNSFYNRHIRNHLVNKIRIAGGEYKEISLYHQNPYKTGETRIPEAFIFIELYDGNAETAYFFPNLIAYEALDFEKSYKSNYLNFLELFRVNDLIDYFYIPFVQGQNPIPHMEQRDKGTILSCRIYTDIASLFDNLTEHAFPPRARATLVKSIMNQGINTAAILDFEGLVSLETAINHYANSRIYWELDDRSEGEWQAAFDTYFPRLSAPIQRAYESTKMKFPRECGDQRVFREAMTLSLGSLFTKMGDADQEIIRSIIGGRSIKNIELAKKYLNIAFSKIEAGDYDNRGLRGMTSILRNIPELEDLDRADSLATLIKADEAQSSTNDEFIAFNSSLPDPLFDIHHCFTFGALQNKLEEGIREIRSGNLKTRTLFEMLLILENEPPAEQFISFKEVYDLLLSLDLFSSTLEEKKKIADFLYQARYFDEEDKWIEKIMDHFNEEPTQKNAVLVSSWLREGSGCIKKNILGAQTILEIAALNSLLWGAIPQ
ncbi:hypothetical protein QM565_19320 [Geitlerinema splendidum]|nr:hypothetical protein [Geitlerinema splendidum]